MSGIKSRKRAAVSVSRFESLVSAFGDHHRAPVHGAIALLTLASPLALAAADPAKASGASPAASASASTSNTLPALKATARTDSDLKPEQLSSPKFVKPLLDTPQTATVISKELLQQQGAVSLSEALANTPGITFALGENGYTATGDSIIMRGFDSSASVFIDGMRDLSGLSRDMFNTEQVEVVKGPAGSDNGRGAPTGYVNLVSKRAQLRDFGSAEARVGSGSRVRVATDINRKLDLGVPGSAVRLNAFVDRGDVLGRDVAQNRRWGVAASVALGLGTASSAVVNLQHVDQNNVPDGGLPALGLGGYTSTQIFKDAASWQKGAPVSNLQPIPSRNFYGSANDYNRGQSDQITLMLEQQFSGDTVLRNTTRLARTVQQMNLTNLIILDRPAQAWMAPYTLQGNPTQPETWTAYRYRSGLDRRNELLAHQAQLSTRSALGGMTHNLSVAVDFIREQQTDLGLSYDESQQARASLYAPNPSDRFAPLTRDGSQNKGSTLTAAASVFDAIDLSERLQLHLGLRQDRYRTEFNANPAPSTPPQAASSLSKSGSLTGAKVGLVYKPAPNGSLYLMWASSQKPPGSDSFALNAGQASGPIKSVNINGINLKPQEARNLEVGSKWELFNGGLLLTAAYYDSQNTNDLARQNELGETVQYGKRSVRGLELGVAGALSREWELQAGLAHMRTRIEQAAVVAPGGTDLQTGAGLRFSPKLSVSSWVHYNPMAIQGLRIGAGLRYQDAQATAENNGGAPITGVTEVPSYWVADAMAAYDLSRDFSVQINIGNLSDKFYLAATNFGRNRALIGAPRNVNLSAQLRF